MGCENCKVKIMNEIGCCTNDLGFGTKIVMVGLRPIAVCKKLRKTFSGKWRCSIHNKPEYPDECAAFECERSCGESTENLGGGLWNL